MRSANTERWSGSISATTGEPARTVARGPEQRAPPLLAAIDRDEIEILFQPQFAADDGG